MRRESPRVAEACGRVPLYRDDRGHMRQDHDMYVMRACVTAWLDHVRRQDAEIRELESRIAEVRERLDGLGASVEGGGRGSGGDRMAEGVARISELEGEWSARVAACMAEIERARDMCSPSHVGRHAMWLHVVEGRTWAYVGRAIGYSERQAKRIADGGCRDLYPLIPEEFRRATFPNAAPL